MTSDHASLISLAKNVALIEQVDAALVCAVCEQESSWNQWAMRFEPMFLAHYVKPVMPEAPSTSEMARATSWGLMQIMGEVAREVGFQGHYFSELCQPDTGLTFGCKKLKACLDRRGDVKAALLMWNGGGNLGYPGQVMARMEAYR